MKAETIIEMLESNGFEFQIHHHEAVFTVEEAEEVDRHIPGGNCKNMLLTNKKKNQYYLIIMEAHKRMDFKRIGEVLQVTYLKFANDGILESFDTFSGSVSPFVILEDPEKKIQVFLDSELLIYDVLNFHPNMNTITLGLNTQNFLDFMDFQGHPVTSIQI